MKENLKEIFNFMEGTDTYFNKVNNLIIKLKNLNENDKKELVNLMIYDYPLNNISSRSNFINIFCKTFNSEILSLNPNFLMLYYTEKFSNNSCLILDIYDIFYDLTKEQIKSILEENKDSYFNFLFDNYNLINCPLLNYYERYNLITKDIIQLGINKQANYDTIIKLITVLNCSKLDFNFNDYIDTDKLDILQDTDKLDILQEIFNEKFEGIDITNLTEQDIIIIIKEKSGKFINYIIKFNLYKSLNIILMIMKFRTNKLYQFNEFVKHVFKNNEQNIEKYLKEKDSDGKTIFHYLIDDGYEKGYYTFSSEENYITTKLSKCELYKYYIFYKAYDASMIYYIKFKIDEIDELIDNCPEYVDKNMIKYDEDDDEDDDEDNEDDEEDDNQNQNGNQNDILNNEVFVNYLISIS